MAAQSIQAKKLSDVITEQLENMIISGELEGGQKLLPERVLAERFNVSRPSLREAIQNLQAKGLVLRKQGGGTFIASNLNPTITDPILDLLSSRPETQFDLLEFRHALEGMAAYYAALRSQLPEQQALKQQLNRIEAELSETLPDSLLDTEILDRDARLLTDFYQLMANASHNMVLQHVMRNLQSMLFDNIKANLAVLRQQSGIEKRIHGLRRDIVLAIEHSDPNAARDANNQLLSFIEQALLDINLNDQAMQRALRRIDVQT